MAKALVIVESPAKAKTIAGFLGMTTSSRPRSVTSATCPDRAAEIPAAYKGESWARLGVDVDNDFKPLYVVSKERQEQVRSCGRSSKDATEVFLATDEDREGESIAWHLLEVLAPQVPVKRMVFHEITRGAIAGDRAPPRARPAPRRRSRGAADPRPPLRLRALAAAVEKGHAAALGRAGAKRRDPDRRRARARADGVPLRGVVEPRARSSRPTRARPSRRRSRRSVGKRSPTAATSTRSAGSQKPDRDRSLLDALCAPSSRARSRRGSSRSSPSRSVPTADRRPRRSSPRRCNKRPRGSCASPRSARCRSPSASTSRATSPTCGPTRRRCPTTALHAARDQAATLYGDDNVPPAPRTYDRKVKNAQEAHEAIRPAGDSFRTPREVAAEARPRRGAALRARLAAHASPRR